VRHTWDADIARYAEVTRILDHARAGESDQELARRSPEALEKMLEKFGCRVTMSDLGVKASMIEAMADSAFKTMAGCLNCSLKSLSRADVIALYKASL
jgi:alcohol dehydrogenase class IV